MSSPWKPLLARAFGALVLLPLLLSYGCGMIAVSGTEPLFLAILVFSQPWVWAVVALVLLCACGPRWAGRALRFALLGQRPLDSADDLGRIAEALALAAPLLGAWAGATVLVFLAVPVQAILFMFVRFR